MSLKRFFFRNRWDDERARELEAHLAIETDDNIARGMTPEDARLAAQRKLGNRPLAREEIYQMNTISFLDSAWRDLRYGARLLRLNPSFAIVAILARARCRREHGDLSVTRRRPAPHASGRSR